MAEIALRIAAEVYWINFCIAVAKRIGAVDWIVKNLGEMMSVRERSALPAQAH